MCIVGGDAFLACGGKMCLVNQMEWKLLAAQTTYWQLRCCWTIFADRDTSIFLQFRKSTSASRARYRDRHCNNRRRFVRISRS